MTKKKEGSTYRYWTPEEDAILREFYPLFRGPSKAAKALVGRKISAVHGRAFLLGIDGAKTPKGEGAGRVQVKDGMAKGPSNRAAKLWQFENKSIGVVISGTNLEHMVREHSRLFDAADIARMYSCGCCRAAMCLRGLSSNAKDKTKIAPSWKGWVFLRKSEKPSNDGGVLQ